MAISKPIISGLKFYWKHTWVLLAPCRDLHGALPFIRQHKVETSLFGLLFSFSGDKKNKNYEYL
jgi:hypothetical protein